MSNLSKSRLSPRKAYLQIALNNTLEEAFSIIRGLPKNDRILIEVGTPLIKRYGEQGMRQIREWYEDHLRGGGLMSSLGLSPMRSFATGVQPVEEIRLESAKEFVSRLLKKNPVMEERKEVVDASLGQQDIFPYIVADLKTMDRGEAEVEIAARGGASAAIALGSAPIETLNTFVASCESRGLDSMIDMMNVEYPLAVLRQLKKIPSVVILHRGVDEEHFNKEKQIPLHEIRRIKGNYEVMISNAGGDTVREVQRSIFNDADIVIVWKSVFTNTSQTMDLVSEFLREIK